MEGMTPRPSMHESRHPSDADEVRQRQPFEVQGAYKDGVDSYKVDDSRD